ncbi:MAG: 2-oxoacid:ferredoxin oxidoreductase subunit beta [Candidatus Eisenbacteria bacterium]|nr:2-oxoacid:ferredoxin oxidoreductase subunit beta [Candidatus Eisenbacteria bacterium]
MPVAPVTKVVTGYLRPHKRFPSVWCAGCGVGIVMGAFLRAVNSLGIDRNKIVVVSGIGCTSRMPVYLDFCGLHTTHGRAIAFATGIKFAKPELTVVVIMGDGDAIAIGGNHFIHAARRNIDLTAIVVNNETYGMTGGQYSPTTPQGSSGSTARHGNIEPPFDICDLARASGATYVAREAVYNARRLETLIAGGIKKRGFSLIEAVSNCYTVYGRYNDFKSQIDMLRWQKEHAVPIQSWQKLPPEEKNSKFSTGVLFQKDAPEYVDEYDKLIERLGGKTGGAKSES